MQAMVDKIKSSEAGFLFFRTATTQTRISDPPIAKANRLDHLALWVNEKIGTCRLISMNRIGFAVVKSSIVFFAAPKLMLFR